MATLELAAPWTNFLNMIKAMFKKDDEVTVDYNEETQKIKILVDNPDKAEALTKLLPTHKTFGNVVLQIEVIPENSETNELETLMKRAFSGNGAVKDIITTDLTPLSFGAVYTLFAKEVVQFFNDDLTDYHGECSTLYEDIAREIFNVPEGVFFCTDIY